MKSISIAGDLLFPSDEEILWLVERYDIVIEEICEANANLPACHIYFKQDGRITKYVSPPELGWKREGPIAPHIEVFISSETEEETVERIKGTAEKRRTSVVKTDFPEMGVGYLTRPGSSGPRGGPSRPAKARGRVGASKNGRIGKTPSAAKGHQVK
ncbi:MAG: hypothetical protein ABSD38_33425 [Syntrophorhabdales bacterium]|jgi:hypothetical protein